MSQFRGYTCDSCGNVIAEGQRTRKTERFDGPVITGERIQDLCAKCVSDLNIEPEALKPLRRRKAGKTAKKAAVPLSA